MGMDPGRVIYARHILARLPGFLRAGPSTPRDKSALINYAA